jgi:hypothetical protein
MNGRNAGKVEFSLVCLVEIPFDERHIIDQGRAISDMASPR